MNENKKANRLKFNEEQLKTLAKLKPKQKRRSVLAERRKICPICWGKGGYKKIYECKTKSYATELLIKYLELEMKVKKIEK